MHSCPDCGQACHCNGDIDDLDFGDDCPEADACQHYQECEKEDDEEMTFEEEAS